MNGALKIILIGLAVLLATGTYLGVREHAEEKRTMQGFLDSVAAMRQRQGVQEAALQARFTQVNVDQYLQSARLASSSDVAGGRAELVRYRALLVERDRLVDSELAQSHALLNTLPEGRMRDDALRGAAKAEARNGPLRSALSQAQTANADAVQAVFDWADRHHAIVHARGATLIVDGAGPLSDLKALEARLGETGQAVDESQRRVSAVQSESVQSLAKLRRDVSQ